MLDSHSLEEVRWAATFLLSRLEKIEAKRWCGGTFIGSDCRCVLGHLGWRQFYLAPENEEVVRAVKVIGKGLLIDANDGLCDTVKYANRTIVFTATDPKTRIMRLLSALKS